MKERLRLMCVLAHPDDESLGMGGTLAKYAAEGIETYLVTATRGERGWFGDEKEYPGLEALGKIREAELLNAARELGIREVKFLDYTDGDLDQANPAEATAKIVSHLRHVRPQVVITFDPNGAYGHPDHIAICQFTTAAVLAAADPNYLNSASPYSVKKTVLHGLARGQIRCLSICLRGTCHAHRWRDTSHYSVARLVHHIHH